MARIIQGGPRFRVRETEILFFRGVARNRPANIRALLKSEGIMPWSIPHIGFSEEDIIEIVSYKEDRRMIQEAFEKHKSVRQLDGKKYLSLLSPQEKESLIERIEATRKTRNFSPPVKRFLRLFRKEVLMKSLVPERIIGTEA